MFKKGESMVDELKLVPLRVPSGWKVVWNIFTEVNPNEFLNDDYEYKWEFNEDILYMVYEDELYGLDLGWYPGFNSEGEYCLRVITDNDWEQTIDEFRSRNINEIKDKIEFFLDKYNYNYYNNQNQ